MMRVILTLLKKITTMRCQWMASTALDTEVSLNYLVFHQNNSMVIIKMICKFSHLKYILMVLFDNSTFLYRKIKIQKNLQKYMYLTKAGKRVSEQSSPCAQTRLV